MSVFNSTDLLHPHLMETSAIIEYLKHRQLAIENIEQKSRDELLKIFHSYAMPLHQRSSTRTKTTDSPMDTLELTPDCQSTRNKHKRIVYEPDEAHKNGSYDNNLPLVTNGCKRMKIGESVSEKKRGLQDIKVDCFTAEKPKRQKITWP